MADDEVLDEGETPAEAAPRGGGLVASAIVVGTLVVGGILGLIVVGPAAAERLSGASAASADSASEHEAVAEVVESYTLESLVLNPADSKGTRFLMVSVVVTVTGAHGADVLGQRDAEIRDLLMSLLGAKTVDELTDVRMRAGIKDEIRTAIASLVPTREVRDVYLPTFVIQ